MRAIALDKLVLFNLTSLAICSNSNLIKDMKAIVMIHLIKN
ncbi:hypothetical protein GLO73106DRAFT_00032070 [Gloeocapsa sp. PCC 73106]|nr:hypothetical protein GLO73106DRAFT_00032070 [Gloeocapsa sp. PCC 73106]